MVIFLACLKVLEMYGSWREDSLQPVTFPAELMISSDHPFVLVEASAYQTDEAVENIFSDGLSCQCSIKYSYFNPTVHF